MTDAGVRAAPLPTPYRCPYMLQAKRVPSRALRISVPRRPGTPALERLQSSEVVGRRLKPFRDGVTVDYLTTVKRT